MKHIVLFRGDISPERDQGESITRFHFMFSWQAIPDTKLKMSSPPQSFLVSLSLCGAYRSEVTEETSLEDKALNLFSINSLEPALQPYSMAVSIVQIQVMSCP